MAYLLSTAATGTWTSASTWSLCNSINFIDSRAASTAITTTAVGNTAFTWASGAPIVQGVAVQLSVRAATPSGTITLQLYNSTGASVVSSLTINVSDISTTFGATGSTWTYFKFASPVTLSNSTNYQIRLLTSVASQVSCYASATTNWSYQLVTTTTQAPVASDSVIVTGTHLSAGSATTSTVTIDNTSATQYGNIFVSNYGTLQFGNAAGTNYTLANNGIAGNVFIIGYGGTMNIGQNGVSYLPTSSTITITLNCASALGTPIIIFGQVWSGSVYANPGGTGTGKPFNKLNADVSAGATSSTLSDGTTGWKSGDQIIVPSTTRTASQVESLILSADQSSTSITHSAYVNAHGGNALTYVQADVANITRNIIIKSGSTTFRSNIQLQVNGTAWLFGIRFENLGTGIAATTAGICVPAPTNGGGFQMSNCVMLNTVTNSTTLSGTGLFTASDTNTAISNNVFYNLGWTALAGANSIFGHHGNNYFIGNYSSSYACISTYCASGSVFASNTAAGAAYSGGFYTGASGCSFYSNSGSGLYFVGNGTYNQSMTNIFCWRNNASGLVINSSSANIPRTYFWDWYGVYCFGNTASGILINATLLTRLIFYNMYLWGGTTFVQQYGFNANGNICDSIAIASGAFGVNAADGSQSLHTTSNLFNINRNASIQFSQCIFQGTEVSGQSTVINQGTNGYGQTFISLNHNGSDYVHKQWLINGTLSTDDTIYNQSIPSLRMSPISGTVKLCTSTFKIPVKNYLNASEFTRKIKLSIKKSSMNLMTFTEDITNLAWLSDTTAVTRTANATTPPTGLGITSACKITESSTATSTWGIYQSIPAVTVIPNINYVFSVYLKAAERGQARVILATSGIAQGYDMFIDLTNGNLNALNQYGTASTLQNYAIDNVGNGWYKVTLSVSFASSAAIFPQVQIRNSTPGSTASYSGTAGWGIFITGAMLYTDTLGSTTFYSYEPVLTTPTNTPYNGQKPRLIQVGNPLTGYPADWVIAELSSPSTYSSSGWETTLNQINPIYNSIGGILEFYIDCDGTQGWINIDDISTTPSNDSRGLDYMAPNGTYLEADWRIPGGSFGFVN